MTVAYLVPSANAVSALLMNVNDYTLINEEVANADGSVNSTNTNDQRSNGTAVWNLTDLPAFDSINSATFRVRARTGGGQNDDTSTYRFRLDIGGSTYDITIAETEETFANKTIAVGTFTQSQYNAATVTLSQTAWNKTKGADGLFCEIDAFELEVDYEPALVTTSRRVFIT